MKTKKNNDLMQIHLNQLSVRIQNAIQTNGFTIYKGVLIVWDKLPDKILLEVVDSIQMIHPTELLLIHFADNLLEMVWKNIVPTNYTHRITDTDRGRIELDPSAYIIPVIFD